MKFHVKNNQQLKKLRVTSVSETPISYISKAALKIGKFTHTTLRIVLKSW